MKEQLVGEIVSETYTTLGLPRDKSRTTPHVQARAAVAVATKRYFTQIPIAEALDIHQSVVSYYKSKHQANLQHWGGYSRVYHIAEDIADKKIYNEVTQVNISRASKEIKILERKIKHFKRLKEDLQGTNL